MKKLFTLALGLSLLSNPLLKAQTSILDQTFGTGGKTITSFGNFRDELNFVTVQTDGKVLFGGYTSSIGNRSFSLVRLNADGTLDNTFGTSGVVKTVTGEQSQAVAIALQSDGKIVLGGPTMISAQNNQRAQTLVRYNTDGTIDNTFGTAGIVNTLFNNYGFGDIKFIQNSLVIQPDGKILASGVQYYKIVIVRYNSDGTLDNTFGTNGILNTQLTTNDFINAIALQSDGKIIAGGTAANGNFEDFTLFRFTTTGASDNTFGTNGRVVTTFPNRTSEINKVMLQPNGKIIVGGTTDTISHLPGNTDDNLFNYAMARYNSDGSADNTFGYNGKTVLRTIKMDAGSSVYYYPKMQFDLQSDGSIMVVSSSTLPNSDFTIFKLDKNGTYENAFGTKGKISSDFGKDELACDIHVLPDGKFLVGGCQTDGNDTNFVVAKYTANVTLGIANFVVNQNNTFVYPNPVNDLLNIEYALVNEDNISMMLYDNAGKLVSTLKKEEKKGKGNYKEVLSLDGALSAGNYIFVVETSSGEKLTKQIIKN